MAQTVRIANPLPGGATYTSYKQAQRFVLRGIAEIKDQVLHFRQELFERRCQSAQAKQIAIEIERDIPIEQRVAKDGKIWWNGCRGSREMFPPFCNVQFPRADF